MHRVNLILNDPDFKEYFKRNHVCEAERIYCGHDLSHALDVARIMYIISLEEQLPLRKEMIYAAGLVHDIGRWMEYETGISHADAGKALAEDLLIKSGFSEAETTDILAAVGTHRISGSAAPLPHLLYRADKLSRNCTDCDAIKTCKRFMNNEEPFLEY